MGLELLLIFSTVTGKLNLPEGLLNSVCYTESKYNVAAVHRHDGRGDSLGICQVKLSTAQAMGFRGTAVELMKPETNVYYAGKYLDYEFHRYGDVKLAVIAYNQGSTKSLTTTAYQRRVFKYWMENFK